MSTGLVSKENCYDDILDWATRREAVVKCRVSDIYRLRATRSLRGSSKLKPSTGSPTARADKTVEP